ncbi:aminotransferase class I/II-fold pyridoxal phosphate-dependent enzyme [Lewinella sp. IMCC34183]|uniref:aminotransferase class I/II-fold pyridoxal phosphate-dependent enzyme n=1 Tax=Lewinella sp. IMCC34183 TaxID=2248762 RepID=UPI001300A980|nr:aminotransferase class I/II-fold pyridoxal phosphate-dependent enzyme [Lewinella sp. IMCC34183]
MAGSDFLTDRLRPLRSGGQYRELPGDPAGVDFWSNDYLGFSRQLGPVDSTPAHTAPGSRLISGDGPALTTLERRISEFHGYASALLFGTGYTANLGLLSALPRRGDTVIYDALIHASLRDGLRLSGAAARRCKHNDLMDADRLLSAGAAGGGQTFFVTESRFSMDGDTAPLAELADLCRAYGAHLIVDEAHAIGIDGPLGGGLVAAYRLQPQVFATVVTYGKAPGFHGAAVLGSAELRNYLINYSRPFIFTTAPRPEQVAGIGRVYDLLETAYAASREALGRVIDRYRERVRDRLSDRILTADGPIQLVPVAGNRAVMEAERLLRADGYLVKGIRSPSVPEGAERLRICLHAFNTPEEIDGLVDRLAVHLLQLK